MTQMDLNIVGDYARQGRMRGCGIDILLAGSYEESESAWKKMCTTLPPSMPTRIAPDPQVPEGGLGFLVPRQPADSDLISQRPDARRPAACEDSQTLEVASPEGL